MKIIFRVLVSLASAYLLCIPAYAGISLSQAIVHFEDGGQRSEDVVVFNLGEETLYVKIEPSVINNPGTPEQTREVYRDPRKAGLLVTPQRLVIAPGARKRIRFVRLDDASISQTDKVFRVLVKPEVGEISASQTAVKVIVAYEVLVLSQPNKAQIKFKHQFEGGKLSIENLGNTNLLLLEGHQCPSGESIESEPNGCVELAGKRLYAGNRWQVEAPYQTPVTYKYSVGLENEIIVFEWQPSDNE